MTSSPLVGRVARTQSVPAGCGRGLAYGGGRKPTKRGLIRIVRRADGGAAIDRTGRASGRGAYVHDDPGCLELARKKRSLDRALHTAIQAELWAELSH